MAEPRGTIATKEEIEKKIEQLSEQLKVASAAQSARIAAWLADLVKQLKKM